MDAYAQLLAEGYLLARHGAGTFVADAAARRAAPRAAEPAAGRAGVRLLPRLPRPRLASRARPWLRALRETLREAPDRAFGYPDPRGAPELRRALAAHLRRVRGVAADPETIVVCAGAAQGFALLARALDAGAGPRLAVEDPGLPPHRAILAAQGAALVALPRGRAWGARGRAGALAGARGPIDGVLVTPGAPVADRRGALARAPRRAARLGRRGRRAGRSRTTTTPSTATTARRWRAMQGLAPDRVVYMGTVSKTLAPALRLGWLVLPRRLVDAVVGEKMLADNGSPTLDQLALARLIESGAYDRHLRQARRRYRARRDALVGRASRATCRARA